MAQRSSLLAAAAIFIPGIYRQDVLKKCHGSMAINRSRRAWNDSNYHPVVDGWLLQVLREKAEE